MSQMIRMPFYSQLLQWGRCFQSPKIVGGAWSSHMALYVLLILRYRSFMELYWVRGGHISFGIWRSVLGWAIVLKPMMSSVSFTILFSVRHTILDVVTPSAVVGSVIGGPFYVSLCLGGLGRHYPQEESDDRYNDVPLKRGSIL